MLVVEFGLAKSSLGAFGRAPMGVGWTHVGFGQYVSTSFEPRSEETRREEDRGSAPQAKTGHECNWGAQGVAGGLAREGQGRAC